jgi:outer membrane murein-binding lipoprotein Lpp
MVRRASLVALAVVLSGTLATGCGKKIKEDADRAEAAATRAESAASRVEAAAGRVEAAAARAEAAADKAESMMSHHMRK